MKHFCKRGVRRALACVTASLAAALISGAAIAEAIPEANVIQSRGADQRIDYVGLTKYGKWDDRNYQLTQEDLEYLSPDEDSLTNQIPAFFRVELRKEWPHLLKSGPVQYPRAAWQLFRMRYGGFLRDGVTYGPKWGVDRIAHRGSTELQLNQVLGANEITVEINPSNSNQVIAGSNNNGGQEMYYSDDGGVTWTIQGTLPSTCCDPTVGWSSDGTVAYAAALNGGIGVSFWRSFDQGHTWVDRVNLTNSGSDKEWLHVDISPDSPHQDNVYLTYHNGNTMQFARSTNGGTSFDITAFSSAPSGIGSDITTTNNGDLYYAYGAFSNSSIVVLKSTDGGETFGAPITVANTNGVFDWPIPAMESRNAWIYATIDADRSGGAFDGSVYLAYTDTIAPESGTASNNHTQIRIWRSRDGGATWDVSTPHPTSDALTVDRFNQWMTVDEFGNVHVVYYDTRNSANRTGTDLYYTYSSDGAVTWTEPRRISSQTSANLSDGQEWGDYNGVSVIGDKVIAVWTDNRNGPPNEKDVFAGGFLNEGAAPSFTLGSNSAATLSQEVCAPGNLDDITLNIGQIQDFSDPVTLSFNGLPSGAVGNFSVNPVTPVGTSIASISVGAVADGTYSYSIDGISGSDTKSVGAQFSSASSVPVTAALSAPANGSTEQATTPTFSWNAVPTASGYLLEVATDAAFSNIIASVSSGATSATIGTSLDPTTLYYWRVTASNACGDSAQSAANSFTTAAEICITSGASIPDNTPAGVSSDASVATGGSILDMRVSLRATHTYVGDLRFTLTHEDTGTSVTLIDRPGVPNTTFGCSADNIDVEMSDASTIAVETTCGSAPALGGVLQPEQPLAGFAGEDIGGTWTLNVSDNAGIDTGTLDEWCLLPALESTAVDTDGDGVNDDLDNCTLVSNPSQLDSNGDGYGNICDADLNNDNVVNAGDLGLLRIAFFSTPTSGNWNPDADLNGDNVVNATDLGLMRVAFFGAPGPSGVAK